MSILATITCQRCHRPYPAYRSRCPYCGTKKQNEVPQSVQTSDSVNRETEAYDRAKESVNWQMMIGGILLLVIMISVITLTSVTVKAHVEELETAEQLQEEIQVAATAPPTATPVPTPSPTPAPVVTSVQITYQGTDMTGFAEGTGTVIGLTASVFPLDADGTVEWTSNDESVATVDEDGNVTVTGSGHCLIYATCGGVQDSCDVWGY